MGCLPPLQRIRYYCRSSVGVGNSARRECGTGGASSIRDQSGAVWIAGKEERCAVVDPERIYNGLNPVLRSQAPAHRDSGSAADRFSVLVGGDEGGLLNGLNAGLIEGGGACGFADARFGRGSVLVD
jgi:hypothetical protein